MNRLAERAGMQMHPLREGLYDELHSRPFQVISSPSRITFLAVMCDEVTREEQFEHFQELYRFFEQTPPETDQICLRETFGETEVRRERHLEFTTYTFINTAFACTSDPFLCTGVDQIPGSWLEQLPGSVVGALHMAIEDARDSELSDSEMLPEVRNYFEGMRLIGSSPQSGDARVWTSFQIHSDDFGRFLIYNRNMSDSQLGRLAQRLMELETYRLMALLSLPLAKRFNPRLIAMDKKLADLTEELTDVETLDEDHVLAQLTEMASEVEALRSQSTFRFGATRAYHDLVLKRLAELREDEVSGHLTLTEFMTRRLSPAVSTCLAAGDRLEDLSRRIDRVSDMMRTRVELSIQSQNRELLESMDRRSKIQLMMQHTVEGLSVAAISYYMIGLLSYLFGTLSYMGLPINPKMATGLSVPLVLIGVWATTRVIHKRFHKLAGEHEESSK